MEAQAMQAVICVAALLLLLVSLKATRLLPAHSEVQPNASVDEVPARALATVPGREIKRAGITFYTAPAPFEGLEAVRQRLAVHSWLRLRPRPHVVLMGQHPSLSSFAQSLEPDVSLDREIDSTFTGNPMFHSMVGRARASKSDVVVLIDPVLVLLQDFTTAIMKFREVSGDWLLVVKPIKMTQFPFKLQDPSERWLRTNGQYTDDDEVRRKANEKGTVSKCQGPGLWAWNTGEVPLHAGVVPPFVYGSGRHSEWLLTEALASKFRTVVDGSSVVTLISPQDVSSRVYAGGGMQGRPWDVAGNTILAMQYGSFYHRPADWSNISMKLVKCGETFRDVLCLVNATEVLEACSPAARQLRLAQISEAQARHGLLKPWHWFGRNLSSKRLQALDCKAIAMAKKTDILCPVLRKEGVKRSELWLPFSLEAMVARVASPDKVVVLSIAGNSYRGMLMSWVCSLRRLNVSNFLVFALDDDLYQYAVVQGVPVVKAMHSMNVSRDDCHFGTKCFQKVTKMKSRTVLHLLQLGYKVLFSDVDVYWFQNPIQEMMSYGPGTLVAQSDQYNDTEAANLPRRLNSGFYFAWPDRDTVAAFQKVVKHALTSDMSEQPSFYDTFCGLGGEYRVGNSKCVEPETNVTVHFLDRKTFPNGASGDHWEKTNVRESCVQQGCQVLHNNWVSGRERKVKRQMAAGLWDFDERTRMCLTDSSRLNLVY